MIIDAAGYIKVIAWTSNAQTAVDMLGNCAYVKCVFLKPQHAYTQERRV